MFFLNGPTSFYLSLSFRTHITSFTANECEICPSSKRCRELNSRPLEYESPPITTRPGLLPWCCVTLWSLLCASLFYVLRQERLQIPFYSQTLFRIASKTADIKTGYAYLWHQMFKWKSINIIAEKYFINKSFSLGWFAQPCKSAADLWNTVGQLEHFPIFCSGLWHPNPLQICSTLSERAFRYTMLLRVFEHIY